MKYAKLRRIGLSSVFFCIFSIIVNVYFPSSVSFQTNISVRRVKDSWIQTSIYSQPTREELLSYDQIQELEANKDGELIELTPEIKQAVVERLKALGVSDGEYSLLLHVLNHNRILLKVDDKGDSRTYDLQDGRKVVSWLDFGDKAIINGKRVIAKSDKGNDIFAYVHITKALYERYKSSPDVLAQTVVRQYQKTFLQDYILNPDYQSERKEFLQKIEQAKSAKDPFAELTVLLDEYNPTFDTMGVVKNVLLTGMLDVFKTHPYIRNGKELLAWYRAEIEVGCQDVSEITGKINTLMQKGNIIVGGQIMRDIGQAHRYLFQYTPKIADKNGAIYNNGNPVYLPHSNYNPENSPYFSHINYPFPQEIAQEFFSKRNNLQEQIDQGNISQDEAIDQLLSSIISGEIGSETPLLRILAKDIKRIRDEVDEENEKLIKNGKSAEIKRPMYSEYALNKYLDKLNDVSDFLDHAIFDNYLVMAVVDMIKTNSQNDREGPFILSVIGPQGGGKSTFCQLLRLALREENINVDKMAIEKDMFARGFRYAPHFKYQLISEEDGRVSEENEGSQEMRGNGMYLWELIPAQLEAIRNGEKVKNPDSGKEVDYNNIDVLIFDGPLTRHGVDLPELVDLTITLTEQESSLRLGRRIQRDVLDPNGKHFSEDYFLNEFAAKQFHQEWDIQRRDTLKKDGSDIALRYGFDSPDELFWRSGFALDIARYQVKQDIFGQIQNAQGLNEEQFKAAEAQIVQALSSFIDLLSKTENSQTIIANIRSLAADFPIFSRGWLSQSIEGLDDVKQERIRSAVKKLIDETKQELKEPGRVVRVIPIGPAGTRGFPFSTQGEYGVPKALNEFGGKTNLTDSIKRAGLGGKDVFMVTTGEIIKKIKDAVSGTPYESHVLNQPSNANTLACVALTVAILAEEYGEDTVVSFMTTDHDFQDLALLEESFEDMEVLAALEPAVSILGIKPTEPNTNMGHIIRKDGVTPFVEDTYVVSKFREKPPIAEAAQLNEQGALWNSGKATGSVSTWLRAFQEFAPDYYQRIQEIRKVIAQVKAAEGKTTLEVLDSPEVKAAIEEAYQYFAQNPAHYITILNDPVPEHSLSIGLGVVPYDLGWSDLGSLRGRWTNEVPDGNGNVVRVANPESVTLKDVSGSNIILASGDTATHIHVAGLENVIVAYNDYNKTLVVVPILYDGNIKKVVNALLANPELSRFVKMDSSTVKLTQRAGIDTERIGTNTFYLADGGDAFVRESGNTRIFSQGGLICASNLSGVTIIKIGDEIYVYGNGYQADADAKLKEILGR